MNIIFLLIHIINGDKMEKDQKINCNVHDCEHCDCEGDCCKLKKIKVCNCDGCGCKGTTMCDSYKEKTSK